MVVVLIIGILAALALPNMSVAKDDRAVYNDAGSIMQLFREARTRAVARGAAEMISMTANGAGDRGTFDLWEAVGPNPQAGGVARLPLPTCTAPTIWTPLTAGNLGIVQIDGVHLNTGATTVEANADIEASLGYYNDPTSTQSQGFNVGYICYTPLGRAYMSLGGGSQPVFDGVLPSVAVVSIDVTRNVGSKPVGTIRSVLLPPNGMARLFSHT